MLLIDYFDRGAARRPDHTCFLTAADDSHMSYREASALTHRVAVSLAREGVRLGTPVAVLSPNDAVAFVAVLGALRCGASWVPLNQRSRAKELVGLLRKTHCEVLIYHERLTELAAEVLAGASSVRQSVAIGRGRPSDPRFDAWLAEPGSVVERTLHEPERPAMLFGTGGTTGEPKAVPVTHRMLETMTLAMTTHIPQPAYPVLAVAAPMTHAAGVIVWPTLAHAGTVVVHDGVNPEQLLRSIERHQVTSLFLPPTAIYKLLDVPEVRQFDYSSLRHFIYASAPMSVPKLKAALEVFGPVMCQTYGQAEAPMIVTCLTPDEHVEAVKDQAKTYRLASAGRPSIVADVAIMDSDGTLLPAGQTGEIVVRGSLVMQGYFGVDGEVEKTSRPGGWHGTSDVGYLDEDGYLYIVDRARDVVITGGFNVWPSEVERVIHRLDEVSDCAVFGVPDDMWGEKVTAVVELSPGRSLTADTVIDWCRQELGPVKTPKQVIFRQLPRSAVGKVLKRALRDEYWRNQVRRV